MAPPTKDKELVRPWLLKKLVAGYQLIDFKDEDQLRQIAGEVEPDFEMQLGKEQLEWVDALDKNPFVLVTIGQKQVSPQVSCYYEMTRGIWSKEEVLIKSKPIWICCYSESQMVASQLITTIQLMLELVKERHQRAIIYLDAMPKASYFQYRSMTYKLINHMLGEEHLLLQVMKKKERAACYLPRDRQYEPYHNRFLYGSSYEQLTQQVIRQLWRREEKKLEPWLYDDLFYESLPMEEKLYLPLVNEGSRASTLDGLNKVSLGKGKYAIYDTRAHIEARKKDLRGCIPSQWTLPLATQIPFSKEKVEPITEHDMFKRCSSYKGEEVYIGIVTVAPITLESSLLRTDSGNSRISCLWEQQEGDQGIYYTGNSIDRYLAQNTIGDEKKSDMTYLLELAGGKEKSQEALACESTFLVAQIKPAALPIQQLYLGEFQPSTVLVADLLIAAHKLLELAELNQKPLVLYLPYFYLLAGDEGKNVYDRLLEELSEELGLTIIMPTGEEADKRHHQLIRGTHQKTFIETQQNQQTIVGIISGESLAAFTAFLQVGDDKTQKVFLNHKGTYQTKVAVIESSGLIWDATSGGLRLRFRIVQQIKSRWQLRFEAQEDEPLRLRLSLREMPLGANAILEPYSALSTANAAPSKWSAIGVGSFDTKHLVAMRGSGRVESHCFKRLTLVAEGRGIIWEKNGSQAWIVEGSAIAASLVTGMVAALYSKWKSEKGAPYPNTRMMQAWLEKLLIKMPEQDYPHLSQGNGILELRQLETALMVPLE